jgi:nucleotide-binding universal stress UspA family protein
MFKVIMVPLDGSKLAEYSLSYAETLAKNCTANEVVLVTVAELISFKTRVSEVKEAFKESDETGLTQSGDSISVTIGKNRISAEAYLKEIKEILQNKGITVRTEVLIGNPAEQITKFAKECGAELIVISSHGRSGPSRWALGSVADKIFRASCVPVLMIRAPGCLPGF